MSRVISSHPAAKSPGRVFVEKVRRVGRKRNFGSMAMIQGEPAICMGYTDDGLNAVYVPARQLDALRKARDRAGAKLGYRMLQFMIRRYEVET